MKSFLYVLALALSIAAGTLSWSNIAKHEKQLQDTTDLDKRNANLETDISKLKKELKTESDNLITEKRNLAETNAEIENLDSKIGTLKRSLTSLDAKIAAQEEELNQDKKLIAEIEALAGEENLTIDQVPDQVEKLEQERKDLSKRHSELVSNVEILQADVDKNNSEISELQRRDRERAKSLRANGLASLITAVNSDWGFVIIKPHPDANITVDSQLIVVRGPHHIGRLKINSVEPNRIIADVDYSSLAEGARIRPGDKVILATARTR